MLLLSRGLVVVTLLTCASSVVVATQQRPAALDRESCSVAVFGNERPEQIPSSVAWERTFDKLAANEALLQKFVLDATRSAVKNRILVMKNDVSRLRSTSSGPSRVLEVSASQAILDTRDDLIRLLPKEQFEHLEAFATDVSDVVYQSPIGGIVKGTRCVISVRGRDYPDMASEAGYWRLYIEGRAAASRRYRDPNGRLTPEHLKAVQSELPFSPDDVQRIVDRCAAVAAYIASLPPLADSTSREIDRAVLALRAELIRSFSPADWNVIKTDANRARTGMVITQSR